MNHSHQAGFNSPRSPSAAKSFAKVRHPPPFLFLPGSSRDAPRRVAVSVESKPIMLSRPRCEGGNVLFLASFAVRVGASPFAVSVGKYEHPFPKVRGTNGRRR
jgi:hypothetical protein